VRGALAIDSVAGSRTLVIWADELDMAHAQHGHQLVQRHDDRVAAALLQTADVLLAEAGELRQLILTPRQPLIAPLLPQHPKFRYLFLQDFFTIDV